jgi:hypothetical protein
MMIAHDAMMIAHDAMMIAHDAMMIAHDAMMIWRRRMASESGRDRRERHLNYAIADGIERLGLDRAEAKAGLANDEWFEAPM